MFCVIPDHSQRQGSQQGDTDIQRLSPCNSKVCLCVSLLEMNGRKSHRATSALSRSRLRGAPLRAVLRVTERPGRDLDAVQKAGSLAPSRRMRRALGCCLHSC